MARFSKATTWALLSAMTASAAVAAENSAIAPRFYESFKPEVRMLDNGRTQELTTKYPASAMRMANMLKSSVMASKHQSKFTTDRQVFKIEDLTAKRSWIIKSKMTADKEPAPHAPLILLELFPNNASVYFDISHMYESEKNWPKTDEYYRKACAISDKSLDKSDPAAEKNARRHAGIRAANIAYFQLMMGHYTTAIKLLSDAIAENPKMLMNYKNRALAYRKLKKDDLAVADEKKLEELSKDKSGTGSYMHHDDNDERSAEMLVTMCAYEKGIAVCDRGLQKDPKSQSFLLTRAQAYMAMGRYKEAAADMKTLTAMGRKEQDFKDLNTTLNKLIAEGPPPYGDLSVLKGVRQRQFSTDNRGQRKAVTASDLAADHKGDYRVYAELVEAYHEQKRWKEMDAQLDNMLKIGHFDNKVLFQKIECKQAQQDWPAAEKACNNYLNLVTIGKANVPSMDGAQYVYMIRGLAREAQKNYTGAAADQTIVLKIEPHNVQALRDRARCYEAANQKASAKADTALADKLSSQNSNKSGATTAPPD